VLIIDDEKPFADLLRDYLLAKGYEVAVADGGLEGFRQASRSRFDLVTMDINMPEVNGVEALRSLQMVGQSARIVVISGYLTDQVSADCRAAGAAAVLAKPVDLAHTGRIFGELLGRTL
jgi:two-component system chemotaxis response regulator CheY